MVSRLLGPLARPVNRLLLRTVKLNDPWRRFAHPVPLDRYGLGSRRDFQWYFEKESNVAVTGLDDVLAFLEGCAYMRDPDLFNEDDFWQHPVTFEQLRKGDCEDFALWVWRKLVRLGFEAEFVAGRHRCPTGECPGHAWVHFQAEEGRMLFDPVTRDAARMLRPLGEARADYVPEVSVDGRFKRYAYGGYYLRLLGAPGTVEAPNNGLVYAT